MENKKRDIMLSKRLNSEDIKNSPSIQLFNCDNRVLMQTLADESIDVICIDPPYLYLKNQKLERPFDEYKFFAECARLLSKNGFIVMFGRGESFYRWNTLLENMRLKDNKYLFVDKIVTITNGNDVKEQFYFKSKNITGDKSFKKVFNFKEEIVWNKSHCTSPLMRLSRVHETVSIFTKGKGTINKVKVPYLEMKSHDLDSVIGDIKRMRSILKNPKSLESVQSFLENNIVPTDKENTLSTSISSIVKTQDRCASVLNGITNGVNEKSIIRTDFNNITGIGISGGSKNKSEKSVTIVQSIEIGMNEKSIIKQVRDHYSAIHPTQKPVRLIERLLALVIPKDKELKDIVVADFFGGSFSTMEAVYNMGMKGISCEIDEEYFEDGKKRIESLPPRQTALFD